ncbi:uncharacterized protein CCOS01_05426 [Colletotrichum costaricense]|uniref:Uncharacterized protein n=1 Tax=Colletotrichum costaricense TaxID=1209916 RepID=A0AAJ0E1M6_9PEZI|nr:uncharacterized protein CCOS01_05426 [Colletotrichum costaricense]KAK1530323.1 hypothetical protein CCOS01_05426 [Colletotrichum costaricense]
MQGRCGGCILIVVPRMEYIRSSNSTPQERGAVVDKGGQVDHQVHHITCETMPVQPRADPIRDVGSDELRAQQMRARRGLLLLASDVGTEIDKVQCDGKAVQVGFVNQALSGTNNDIRILWARLFLEGPGRPWREISRTYQFLQSSGTKMPGLFRKATGR